MSHLASLWKHMGAIGDSLSFRKWHLARQFYMRGFKSFSPQSTGYVLFCLHDHREPRAGSPPSSCYILLMVAVLSLPPAPTPGVRGVPVTSLLSSDGRESLRTNMACYLRTTWTPEMLAISSCFRWQLWVWSSHEKCSLRYHEMLGSFEVLWA